MEGPFLAGPVLQFLAASAVQYCFLQSPWNPDPLHGRPRMRIMRRRNMGTGVSYQEINWIGIIFYTNYNRRHYIHFTGIFTKKEIIFIKIPYKTKKKYYLYLCSLTGSGVPLDTYWIDTKTEHWSLARHSRPSAHTSTSTYIVWWLTTITTSHQSGAGQQLRSRRCNGQQITSSAWPLELRAKVLQSRRRPLLRPSPGWKRPVPYDHCVTNPIYFPWVNTHLA